MTDTTINVERYASLYLPAKGFEGTAQVGSEKHTRMLAAGWLTAATWTATGTGRHYAISDYATFDVGQRTNWLANR